ncbi:hypothetical protein Tco_1168582 [Tanacetum coccineum]
MAFALVGAIKHLRLFHSILKLDRKVETFRGILFLRDALLRYDGLFDSLSAPLLLLSCICSCFSRTLFYPAEGIISIKYYAPAPPYLLKALRSRILIDPVQCCNPAVPLSPAPQLLET